MRQYRFALLPLLAALALPGWAHEATVTTVKQAESQLQGGSATPNWI
jgi:beta-lactamase class A/beta-lactamase class A TEM